MITVVIISFHSKPLILKRIKEIGSNVPVIIIENSKDLKLKEEIEKNYPNVKVIIPESNLGFGAASNLGIRLSKTDFVFLTQADLELINNCVDKLIDCIKSFKDFTIITPLDIGNKDFVNYEIYNNKKNILNNPYDLVEVDYVDLSWLINMKNFNQSDYWDEKIFLYFEALDFAKRLRKNNKKIYIAKKINSFHLGLKSHEEKYNFYANLNRNWHYNWGKFYYFNKHFGYFFAIRKTLPNLLRETKEYIKCKIFNKKDKCKLHFAAISGLLSSYLKKPSSYRPYEKV